MKNILVTLSLATIGFTSAQNKTVLVVENNLANFETYNKYNLNENTKLFLESEGFTVYNEKDLPEDIKNNRCSAYYINYTEDSGIFTTGLMLHVKDCHGKIIYTSELGKTREKDYRVAYREAFRNTAKNFQLTKNTIPFDTTNSISKEQNTNVLASTTDKNNLVFSFAENVLQGELKDLNDKVLYKLTKTSVDNLYMASNQYVDGIIYLKEGKWYFEFTKNGEKIIEEIK